VGIVNRSLFTEAQRYLPGGVNSPVRAFSGLDREPLFIDRGAGCRLYDSEGGCYTDYCLSWGALPLGHAHPAVVDAAVGAVRNGSSFGAPTRIETALAQFVSEHIASCELVRFVSSGTEAVMTALRLARAFTGRNRILKFDGGYHGHCDAMLVRSGSGVSALAGSSSAGVPPEVAMDTLSIPFNDVETLERAIRLHGDALACVIVEPIPANMGLVPPAPGFLRRLRELTAEKGVLLVFDEVITGFRLHCGGVQDVEHIIPDITTLGKIVGGGFPAAAVGGRRKIMEQLAPAGPVYQAGTLSGNPVAMAAGLATLQYLAAHAEIYGHMAGLVQGFAQKVHAESLLTVNHCGPMFTLFCTGYPVTDYATARTQDAAQFRLLHRTCLDRGIYLPPSMFETAFISSCHKGSDLERLAETVISLFPRKK
jgi:glutamate-1-semialdehyde 2,1-aminomutase